MAKASFAGMRLLHAIDGRIPIWPFDPLPGRGPDSGPDNGPDGGPDGGPDRGMVIVEIYTAIAARAAGIARGRSKIRDAATLDRALAAIGSGPHAPLPRYDDHATDAILTAAWLRTHATRRDLWHPAEMTPLVAQTEGWTFGVG